MNPPRLKKSPRGKPLPIEPNEAIASDKKPIKKFLHVGCGRATKANTIPYFMGDDWREVRYDIDPSVSPDILGTMTDMSAVPSESVDAVYSSHNIEHLYAYQVVPALTEFNRVLKPDGFVIVSCPDLKAVCKMVADGRLMDVAYQCGDGPVSPHDIIYGFGPDLARGFSCMAHKCGFTLDVLFQSLADAGFTVWAGHESSPLSLTAIAKKDNSSRDDMLLFAQSVLGVS